MKTQKRDKVNLNRDHNKKKTDKEEELIKTKLPKPIIYDPIQNQINVGLVEKDDENEMRYRQDHKRITRDAKEIANYYLELHKNMVNTYNYVYSQILQNKIDLSSDVFFTNIERFADYSFEIKDFYLNLIGNRDESLKLVDNIITENLDTFIKSLDLIQKFYKNIMESYNNSVK